MKHTFLFVLIVLISTLGFSQKQKQKKHSYKPVKNMKFIPPGKYTTITELGEKELTINGFWMSNEITNKEFREFYLCLEAYPDSSFKWIDLKSAKENEKAPVKEVKFSDIFKEITNNELWKSDKKYLNSLTNKEFDYFPVTGISYDAARYYCWWRSMKENQSIKDNEYLVEFRLAFSIEWEYASQTKQQHHSFIKRNELSKSKEGDKVDFGLINMHGNVSEFVNSTDCKDCVQIKGSSIKEELKTHEIKKVESDYRDENTGFRIVQSYIGVRK